MESPGDRAIAPSISAIRTERAVTCSSRRGICTIALLVLPAAVAGLLIGLTLVRFGIAVSPDSTVYFAAARSLLGGSGFRSVDGGPYTLFPPALPALLAVISLPGTSLTAASIVINVASAFASVLLAGLTVLRATRSRLAAFLVSCTGLISLPFLSVWFYAWSEPIFILSLLLFLYFGQYYLAKPSLTLSLGLAGCVAIASLTRYVGVVLVVPGLFLLAIAHRSKLKEAIRESIAFTAVSTAPIAVWLVRNLYLSNTLRGERYALSASGAENRYAALSTLLSWLIPHNRLTVGHPTSVAIGALFCIVGISIYFVSARRLPYVYGFTVIWFAFNVSFYLFALLVISSQTGTEVIEERYIAPIYIPTSITIIIFLYYLYRQVPRRHRLMALIPSLVVLVAGLVFHSLPLTVEAIRRLPPNAANNYQLERWKRSELLRLLRRSPVGGTLYSNDPYAISYQNRATARLSPQRFPEAWPQVATSDIEQLVEATSCGTTVYLAWFDGVPRDILLSPQELSGYVQLSVTASTGDGKLYRLRSTDSGAHRCR